MAHLPFRAKAAARRRSMTIPTTVCLLHLLIVLAVVVSGTTAQSPPHQPIQQQSQQDIDAHSPSNKKRRYAVVQFIDESDEYLWGLYSTHVQLNKFGMTPHIEHIAMVSQDISPKSRNLIEKWLGPDAIRIFDRSHILEKVPKRNLRQGVFLKLEAFNMTEFDKIVVLDNDILVRTNLEHWFDYPAPAATGARGMIEWNSGAMVIEPRTSLYEKLIEYLAYTRRWMGLNHKKNNTAWRTRPDPWNSNGGQQGFISAFFLSNVTDDAMFTMSYGHSVLSSDLDDRPHNAYYFRYRPHVFETVHFTRHKPWKPTVYTKNAITCTILAEWMTSVASVAPHDRDQLPTLPNVMKHCPISTLPSEGEFQQQQQE